MKYFFVVVLLSSLMTVGKAQTFTVTYTPAVYKAPFSGSVILYLSQKNEQPKNKETGWPCYRMKVRNSRAGDPIRFSDSSLSYPTLLSRIPRGAYYVQAVYDLNSGDRIIGRSSGNLYSISRKITLNDTTENFDIVCDQAVVPEAFADSKYVKEVKVLSSLLSKFEQRPCYISGAVILPEQYYTEPARRFPLYFIVGGFGGGYHHYSKTESTDTLAAIPLDTIPVIKIYLDGDCPLGHSVYANSDNNHILIIITAPMERG